MQDVPESLAGEVVDDDALPPGDWLPPAAAASRLGVSERTLWRLVKAGRYQRRVVDRKAMILVPTTVPLPDTSATSATPFVPDTVATELSGISSGVTDTAILAVVDELKRQSEASLALVAQQAETIGRQAAEIEALKASHRPLADQETPAMPAPTTNAPAQHQISLGAAMPWLFTALALVASGRAATADVSPEVLIAGAVIVAVAVTGYVGWRRWGGHGG